MRKLFSAVLIAVAFIQAPPAVAADLDARPAAPRSRNFDGRGGYVRDDAGFFGWSYEWPGGQTGPCWRRWYGQWVWSC